MINSSSRQAILDRLRTRSIETPELPQIDPTMLIHFEDPLAQFCESARGVGAAVHRVDRPADVAAVLEGLEPFRDARSVASLVPSAVVGNTELASCEDPRDLKALDWLIAEGDFGVAENGAIWMRAAAVHRVSFFITQYLVVVLPQSEIVPHMHAAYDRIGPTIDQNFGVFIAGPSKTADIEQSLVLGAHGCRALHIFLCG